MTDDKQNKSLITQDSKVMSTGEKAKEGAKKLASALGGLLYTGAHKGAAIAGGVKRSYDLSVQGSHNEAEENRDAARIAMGHLVAQGNNMKVTAQLVPEHMADASDEEKAEKIEKMTKENPDFVANCWECCKNRSDDEVRARWAKLMAKEADRPGSFSHKTLSILRDMGGKDVRMFEDFCQYVAYMVIVPAHVFANASWDNVVKTMHGAMLLGGGFKQPFIYDYQGNVFPSNMFDIVMELEAMGLVSRDIGYCKVLPDKTDMQAFVSYHSGCMVVEIFAAKVKPWQFQTGNVLLTKAGEQLFTLCKPKENKNFLQYLKGEWKKRGYNPVYETEL